MSDNKGTGTPIPIPNEPRITGGTGHVNVGGTVVQGTNIGGGKVQTPDGKIHG
ncbi:hypothetical protein [Tritonibacter scottomollicae]|uniref:Uncharacterized protein n=1 Tax=Tritonibacter scottomollicae TaxID=483013 RepID=A0A2T1AKF5_TRISK|nr:hypothetical protein [Tritonibacter scottomollicae]PRZ49089.1 hypothetical protein CLV89_103404 [Tritonibacter scottomollicae]